jgi:hypothetical protein
LYRDNRVSGAVLFQMVQDGEPVKLKVWRDRKAIDVEVPVAVYRGDRLAGNHYDTPPRYLIHGGLVFTPLSADYLRTLGRDRPDASSSALFYELYYRRSEDPEGARTEPVVLATTLAHPVNANLRVRGKVLVNRINGVRIGSLEDVARALEQRKEGAHVIEFAGQDGMECLEREASAQANPQILETYGISSDRRL